MLLPFPALAEPAVQEQQPRQRQLRRPPRLAPRSARLPLPHQHPHLSLAQIHAALGYYYDHQPELDAQVQRGVSEVQRLRMEAGESPVQKRLREMGKLT